MRMQLSEREAVGGEERPSPGHAGRQWERDVESFGLGHVIEHADGGHSGVEHFKQAIFVVAKVVGALGHIGDWYVYRDNGAPA